MRSGFVTIHAAEVGGMDLYTFSSFEMWADLTALALFPGLYIAKTICANFYCLTIFHVT